MSHVDLECTECNQSFLKEKREYNRLIRNSRSEFYCSLSCAGKKNVKNLPNEWNSSQDNIDQLNECQKKAALVNRKYDKSDLVFHEYHRRCKRRKKHTVDVSFSYLRELWEKQGGRCALSNIPLKLIGDTTDHNVMASLDRIDSGKGYLIGNVQFVSCALNLAKRDRSDESLRALLRLIVEHQPVTT